MKLTDEQVVRILAKRDGLKQMRDIPHRPCGYEPKRYNDWWYGYKSANKWCAWLTPPYLESLDALAPVLAGLSREEKHQMHMCLARAANANVTDSELREWQWVWWTHHILTLPPADLARAIAEAISK